MHARTNPMAIHIMFQCLMARLASNHCNTRLLASMIMDVLFQRSHVFRALCVDRLTDIYDLTLGLSTPLPGPDFMQPTLSLRSLLMFQGWTENHGDHHPHLKVALRHVTGTLKMSVPSIDAVKQLKNVNQGPKRKHVLCSKLRTIRKKKLPFNHVFRTMPVGSYLWVWWDLDHHSW